MPDVKIEPQAEIDLITPTGPATSASSDMPRIETKPDVQVKSAPDKAKEADSEPAEKPESASADPEAPKAKGVQKRLDELTRNWREEQRARESTQAQLERTLGLLEKAMAGKPAETVSDDEPQEPDAGKYTDQNAYNTDYRKYLKDVAAFAGRQAARETTKRDTEETTKQRQEEASRKRAESYRERVAKAREKYPDYDAVTTSDSLPITEHMRDAIIEDVEYGTDVAHFLGTHVEEADRIARLSPRRQFMELGYLTAQFRQQAKEEVKPEIKRAPAPIKPLGTGSRGAVSSAGEESMEAYAAKRKPQLDADRRPGGRR